MKIIYTISLLIFVLLDSAAQSFIQGPYTNTEFYSPVMADFNGDGKIDIAGIDLPFFGDPGSLIIHKNITENDKIGFEEVYLGIPSLGRPGFGDFDNDGSMDIVVTRASDSKTIVLFNVGDDNYDDVVIQTKSVLRYRTGDMDGDSDIDIVAFNLEDNSVYLLRNDGEKVFESFELLSTTEDLNLVEIGDVDGDNDIDIVVAFDEFFDAKIMILKNIDGASYQEEIIKENSSVNFRNIEIIDLNNDSFVDIVYSSSGSTLRGFINSENQTYNEVNIIQGDDYIQNFAMSDYNTDGINDIVIGYSSSSSDMTFHKGLSIDNFEYGYEVISGISSTYYLINGDLDNDDDIDIMVSNGDIWWLENELEQQMVDVEEQFSESILVFPNPFYETLNIKGINTNVDVLIADLMGQTVLYQKNQNSKINVSFLNNGMYLMSLFDTNSGEKIHQSSLVKLN
ncbi:MAG: hypothetical protein ACI86M_003440 [Saprospiraceae bacterium]|jgi:hypothetical protein